MMLLTKAIEKALGKSPLYSTDGTPVEEKKVIVKFFNPTGAGSWFAFEGEKVDGDWRFFGLVTGLGCNELGYFMLSELAAYRGSFGLGIERDRYAPKFVDADGRTVRAPAVEMRMAA